MMTRKMKKQTLTLFATLILFVLSAVALAHAQAPEPMKGNITFDFHAGDKSFPAGEYSIEFINRQTARNLLLIRSADGRESAMFPTTPVRVESVQRQARLTFNRYGKKYFLSQFLTPGVNTGLELSHSRVERAVRRGMSTETISGTGATGATRRQAVTLTAGR